MLFNLSMNLKADDIELSNKANNRRKSTKREVEFPLFSFSSVAAATNNFSDTNKLGEGGFGPVYKVKFHSSNKDFDKNSKWIILDLAPNMEF